MYDLGLDLQPTRRAKVCLSFSFNYHTHPQFDIILHLPVRETHSHLWLRRPQFVLIVLVRLLIAPPNTLKSVNTLDDVFGLPAFQNSASSAPTMILWREAWMKVLPLWEFCLPHTLYQNYLPPKSFGLQPLPLQPAIPFHNLLDLKFHPVKMARV